MSTKSWITIMCVGAVIVVAGMTYSAEDGDDADGISLLHSNKSQDRVLGQRSILRERRRVVQALIDIIKAPRSKSGDYWLNVSTSRNTAIACIGEYRAPEAVPALLSLLEPAPGERVFTSTPFRLCPAGHALVNIGKPSVSALINLLATTDTETMYASQARLVVYDIEGAEAGEKILKGAVAGEKDATRRASLEANVKRFHAEMAGH